MIDFGLAKRYKDSSGKHIPYADEQPVGGTARYASINCHNGIEVTRRDDMESLGYIFVYILRGGYLPWMDIK